ncbi:MAG: hypothetical protein DRQ47_05885, partial [Gammaproteobacteria bacterium]
MNTNRPINFTSFTAAIIGIGLPIIGSLFLSNYEPDWKQINVPAHAAIESAGGIIAIALSLMTFFLVKNVERKYYFITASALLIMGSLNIAHASFPPGQQFVWLHSLATFSGGAIFALVWFNKSPAYAFQWSVVLALLLIFISILMSDFLPLMVFNGKFTLAAKILNVSGGICFYLAAAFFLQKYRKKQAFEFLLFVILCVLFGTAGILFEESELWDAAWWWWHLLSLTAYVFALGFIILRLKEQNKQIVDTKLRTELLMESAGEGIYGLDIDGNCTWANKACARLSGCNDPGEMIGKNMHEFQHHSHADGRHAPQEDCNIYRVLNDEVGVHIDDEVFWRMDGSSYPAEYWSSPIFEKNVCTGAVVSFSDISKRKELEARLRQSERMEAIGTLVGGIAHDFNNMLASIMGYTELSIMKLAGKNELPIEKHLKEVIKSSKRAKELVAQMLTFARGADEKLGRFNLSPLIEESLKMLGPTLPSSIE